MALWTPEEITTALWLDASDASTITIDTGVSEWADKSGNSNDVAQITGTAQPTVALADQNSLDTINFASSNSQYLSGGDVLDLRTESINIFAVVKHSSFNTAQTVIAKSRSVSGIAGRLGLIKNTSNIPQGLFQNNAGTYAVSGVADTSTNYNFFHLAIDRTAGTEKLYRNGTQTGSTTSFTPESADLNTNQIFLIGAYNDSTTTGIIAGQYLNGYIGEIVILRSALSDSDRQKIEGYLAWKWGLEANLPSGHPYELSAPFLPFDPSIISNDQKIKLTLDSSAITSDQTDFPLTVVLDGADTLHAALFADLGANSKKLSIESGTTQLPVDVESWDLVPQVYSANYPPEQNTTYVKATSLDSSYPADNATDPTLSLTGVWTNNQWFGANNQNTNQKFNIDIGEAKVAKRLYLENSHSAGQAGSVTSGIATFILYGTNEQTAFDNVTYADTTDLTELGSFLARTHISSNVSDPQYFDLSSNETAYRYYVLRIANCYGSTQMGIRHLEIQSDIPEHCQAVLHIKVPTYSASADGELVLSYDSTHDDNTSYVGDTNEARETVLTGSTFTNNTSSGASCRRLLVGASALSDFSGKKFRLKFGRYNTDYPIDEVWIFKQASAGDAYDAEPGSGVQVKFGGSASTTITSTNQFSDPIDFDIDGTEAIIISFYHSTGIYPWASASPSGCTQYYKDGGSNEAGTEDVTGFSTSGAWIGLSAIVTSPVKEAVWVDRELMAHLADELCVDSASNLTPTITGLTSADVTPGGLTFIATDKLTYPVLRNAGESFSVGYTINPTSMAGYGPNISFSDPAAWGALNWHTDNNVGTVYCGITASSRMEPAESGALYYVGETARYFFVYDSIAGTGAFYKNGVLVHSEAMAVPTASTILSLSIAAGIFKDLVVSKTAFSPDKIKLDYLSLADQLITYSAYSVVVDDLIVAWLNEDYSNYPLDAIQKFFNEIYSINFPYQGFADLVYGLRLGAILNEHYGDAAVKKAFLNEYYGNVQEIRKYLDEKYGDTRALISILNEKYNLSKLLEKFIDLKYSISNDSISNYLNLLYSVKDVTSAKAWMELIYAINAESVVEASDLIVTIDGTRVYPYHVTFEFNRDSYKAFAEIHLADQESYLLCKENQSILRIQDGIDDLYFEVEVPREMASLGETSYVIPAESKSRILERAPRVTKEFSAGLASDIAISLAAEYGITVTWSVTDWFIPAGNLYANDEAPIEVIRKLSAAIGAKLQPTLDGNLRVLSNMQYDTTVWNDATPTYYLTDQANFFSTSEDSQERDGYNKYRISNYTPADKATTLEEVSVKSNEKILKGFKVPFNSKELLLFHSGGDWVGIEKFGETEETLTETVEIISGQGSVSRPIYNITSYKYNAVALGAVTYNEDGTLTCEVAAQSLLEITYVTKYWSWRATSPNIEEVQFWVEEAE